MTDETLSKEQVEWLAGWMPGWPHHGDRSAECREAVMDKAVEKGYKVFNFAYIEHKKTWEVEIIHTPTMTVGEGSSPNRFIAMVQALMGNIQK